MKRAMTIAVVILAGLAWYAPHAKRGVNACRFEVAKK